MASNYLTVQYPVESGFDRGDLLYWDVACMGCRKPMTSELVDTYKNAIMSGLTEGEAIDEVAKIRFPRYYFLAEILAIRQIYFNAMKNTSDKTNAIGVLTNYEFQDNTYKLPQLQKLKNIYIEALSANLTELDAAKKMTAYVRNELKIPVDEVSSTPNLPTIDQLINAKIISDEREITVELQKLYHLRRLYKSPIPGNFRSCCVNTLMNPSPVRLGDHLGIKRTSTLQARNQDSALRKGNEVVTSGLEGMRSFNSKVRVYHLTGKPVKSKEVRKQPKYPELPSIRPSTIQEAAVGNLIDENIDLDVSVDDISQMMQEQQLDAPTLKFDLSDVNTTSGIQILRKLNIDVPLQGLSVPSMGILGPSALHPPVSNNNNYTEQAFSTPTTKSVPGTIPGSSLGSVNTTVPGINPLQPPPVDTRPGAESVYSGYVHPQHDVLQNNNMDVFDEAYIQYTEDQIKIAIKDLNTIIAPGMAPSDPAFMNEVGGLLNTYNNIIIQTFITSVFSQLAGITDYQQIVDLLDDPLDAMVVDVTKDVNDKIGDKP